MKPSRPTQKQIPKCPECRRRMRLYSIERSPPSPGKKRRGPWQFRFYCGYPARLKAKLETSDHERVESTSPMTKAQVKRHLAHNRFIFRDSAHLHKLSWAFERAVKWEEALKDYQECVKESGYPDIRALLDRAKRAIKRLPKILAVRVDDDHHCGSELVLVPHETPTSYMGASVYHFPQCGGIPTRFFLYPGHVNGLIEALKVLQKKARSDER